MKPISTKELNYITDMLGAEEMTIRTCAAAYAHAQEPDARQFLHHAAQTHQRHYDELVHLLQQHEHLAH